jgi:methyl-accepting chemotaxis protein
MGTLIFEKDYAKDMNPVTAETVLLNIESNISLLKKILDDAEEKQDDLNTLSELLETYKKKFMLLLSNNNKITSLKYKWDELFEDFYQRSDEIAQKVDNIIGMAYLDGDYADPLYGSFAISNKNMIHALSEISLAVNRDLLLHDDEEGFLEMRREALELLEKERKNITALSKNMKEELFVGLSAYTEEHLEKIADLTEGIHLIWKDNTKLSAELDAVRKGMIVGEKGISSWIQSSLEDIKETNFTYAMVGVFLILLVLFIGGLIILTSVLRPINNLTAMVKNLAHGEGDLRIRLEMKRQDEMGELAGQFNIFIKNIQSVIKEIAKNAQTLTESSSNYLKLASHMSEGSDRMSRVSTSVSTATEEVSVNINTMATATEEMSVNVESISSTAEQVSHNMNAVASSIEEMVSAINEIASNAQEGAMISDEAMKMMNTATATMNTLDDTAKEIGSVTRLITRIAEQTNLLALNATIEAASAGHAGKGFAVVANEIKELAGQSARAAENIAKRIRGVQKDAEGAVGVIENIVEIIRRINTSVMLITNAVDQQTHTANDIMSNVRQANIGSASIAASIAEVAKGASDMSKNAGEAAKGANEVSSNIQNIMQAADEANTSARQLNISAEELSGIAVQLREMVERFKV